MALSAIRWPKNLQSHRGYRVLLGHAEQSPDADVLIDVGPLDNQPLGLNLEVVSLGLRRSPQTARPGGRSCDHSSVGQDEGWGDRPRLIDEWQLVPAVWNQVRLEVDAHPTSPASSS